MLKTLGKTTWDKIKINEVFASKGCWLISIKLGKNSWMNLACTTDATIGVKFLSYYDMKKIMFTTDTYKLPKSVQKLFKEE